MITLKQIVIEGMQRLIHDVLWMENSLLFSGCLNNKRENDFLYPIFYALIFSFILAWLWCGKWPPLPLYSHPIDWPYLNVLIIANIQFQG